MVLVIDSDDLMRRVLRRSFAGSVAVGTIREGVEAACQMAPELVIMDARLDDGDGIEAIPAMLRACPETRVMVFAMRVTGAERRRALDAGAVAYVHKLHIDRVREIVADIMIGDPGRRPRAETVRALLH